MELKVLRIRANLSQAETAEKVGVTQANVSLWEKGEHKPGKDIREKLAEAYGVTMEVLEAAIAEDWKEASE